MQVTGATVRLSSKGRGRSSMIVAVKLPISMMRKLSSILGRIIKISPIIKQVMKKDALPIMDL